MVVVRLVSIRLLLTWGCGDGVTVGTIIELGQKKSSRMVANVLFGQREQTAAVVRSTPYIVHCLYTTSIASNKWRLACQRSFFSLEHCHVCKRTKTRD